MIPTYDIFLACAPKDFNKLPYVVQSIVDNVEGYDNIIICSPVDIPVNIQMKIPAMYYLYFDNMVLPEFDRDNWPFRTNWSFQQHLKLFQQVTQDWYATIDCDTFFNRKFKFFEGNKPIYWKGLDQFFPPYFKHMKQMIGLDKIPGSSSYVADMNFIYRPIIEEMLDKNNYTVKSFIEKSMSISCDDCCIGEPELYGTYVHVCHPDMYIDKKLKQKPYGGKIQENINELKWDENEIKQIIEKTKNIDADVLSIHSWLKESNKNEN